MLSVLVLWIWAAYRSHPLAPSMLVAIGASIAAAATKLPGADLLRPVGLDPDSAYHLAQIVGIALLYVAITGVARGRAGAWNDRLRHETAGSG
jgi:hypothetical protein